MRFCMPVTRPRLVAVALAMCISVYGCSGSGSSESPTSPSSSGGAAPTAGAWTGTITRPGGLDPVSVRWEVTTNTDGLIGPMTLTSGGASVTVTARGNTSGNDRQGYAIHTSFNSHSGDIPAGSTGCTVRGNTMGPQEGDPFPQPYTTISVPVFSISYSGCRGFIDSGYSSPQSNFIQETVQLNLRK
jgi:hypothetical protein